MIIELMNSKKASNDIGEEAYNVLQNHLMRETEGNGSKYDTIEAGKGLMMIQRNEYKTVISYFRYPLHARIVAAVARKMIRLGEKMISTAKSFL